MPASGLLARLRLLRFSNFPSPLGDVAAGAALSCAVAGGAPLELPRLGWSLAASAAVYHAGMALNDWADRAEDGATRPGRPIPSGAVSAGEALVTGVALLLLSLAASAMAGNVAIVSALAMVVVLYDLAAPRGSWIGPLLLGLARALNFTLGLSVAKAQPSLFELPWPLDAGPTLVAAAYGTYVAGISFFALAEDRPWSRGRAWLAGALCLSALAACAASLVRDTGSSAAALLWCVLLEPLSVILGPPRPWTPERIGQLVGAGLRGTLVFQACVAASAGAPAIAAALGAGYLAARWLARWIPPT